MAPPRGLRFELPDDLVATGPPEDRGLARDEVRLLVARPQGQVHARVRDLDRFLRPGDLLVVNTSATLPAALDARRGGQAIVIHRAPGLADRGGFLDPARWVVELRALDRSGPILDGMPGEEIVLPGGVTVTLVAPAATGAVGDKTMQTAGTGAMGDTRSHDAATTVPLGGTRLWHAAVRGVADVDGYLRAHGRPITYSYLRSTPPLRAFQTIFAMHPGSAEMPSAGRPLSAGLLARLVASGVAVAPITLHTGVSSPEAGEPPQPEWFRLPAATARLIELTRASGHRVVAVGTTVTRALESAVRGDGSMASASGWTNLVLGPDNPARAVDGLLTGWHAPQASHLALLEAVAGAELVGAAYAAALDAGYLWHEFGDSCLLLPEVR